MRAIPFYGNPGEKYQGLPEFIADSLPDSWGNTLFDKWMSENNISSVRSNSLLKLSFMGRRAMGALEFYPEVYDEKLKFWRLDTLPFLPEEYKYFTREYFKIAASSRGRTE